MEAPSIGFTLSGSFIVEPKLQSQIGVPVSPNADDSSPVCQFIKENFPQDMSVTVRSLFTSIEKDHETIKNLYLSAKEVFIIPGVAPTTPYERIALARKLLANTLSFDELRTSASGHSQLAVSTMPSWERFVVAVALRHFQKLLQLGYYKNEAERTAFIQAVFSMFEPQSKDIRLVTPVKLVKGRLSIRDENHIALVVRSQDDIVAQSADLLSWPAVTFDAKSSVFDGTLTLTSVDSERQVQFGFSIPSETIRNAIWTPACPIISSTKAVVDSFRGYYGQMLTGGAAASLARVVGSIDTSFILSLYQTFSGNVKLLEPVIHALTTLFMSESNELQLVKTVAYYELAGTKNVNEIFRGNNNYTRTILTFLNRVTEKYKQTVVKDLCCMLTSGDDWNFDSPREDDVRTVGDLLRNFIRTLITRMDEIPASVRTFCRYLRVLSERMFRNKILNHRAVFALVILRFLCPALMAISNDPKVTKFSKLLVYACQFQRIDCESHPQRSVLNIVINNVTDLVIEFYNKLCVETKNPGVSIVRSEIVQAASTLRDYIQEHEKEILEKSTKMRNSHMFVDELLCEFITQSKSVQ